MGGRCLELNIGLNCQNKDKILARLSDILHIERFPSDVKKRFEKQATIGPERRQVPGGFATIEHSESVVKSILYEILIIRLQAT